MRNVKRLSISPSEVREYPAYIALTWDVTYEVAGWRDPKFSEGLREIRELKSKLTIMLRSVDEKVRRIQGEVLRAAIISPMKLPELKRQLSEVLSERDKIKKRLATLEREIRGIYEQAVRDTLKVRYSRVFPRKIFDEWKKIVRAVKIPPSWLEGIVRDAKKFALIMLLAASSPAISIDLA
ncbi:MAG TPA: hypothetical protein EYP16_03335 [Candidatus Atribacteria bacterium]|nr:hypothetical protein [Candidatus Atribacteria bacterium]